jgi:hypothetical protein
MQVAAVVVQVLLVLVHLRLEKEEMAAMVPLVL